MSLWESQLTMAPREDTRTECGLLRKNGSTVRSKQREQQHGEGKSYGMHVQEVTSSFV